MPNVADPVEGGFDCRVVRYRMTASPLVVRCCHCRWCQRESGSASQAARCPAGRVAVWGSHYAGSGPLPSYVGVGTLDDRDALPPDGHIFVAPKQPSVLLPAGTPAFDDDDERDTVWSHDSLQRRQLPLPLIDAWRASRAQP